MRGYSLFDTSSWHEFADSIVRQACDAASRLSRDQFEANSKERITEHIMATYELEPLELQVNEKSQDVIETEVDVSGNYNFIHAFDDEPTHVPGYKVVVHIPYRGSEALFSVQPSTHTLRNFSADAIGGELSFSKEFLQDSTDAKDIERAINSEIAFYQKEISYLDNDLMGFNDRLRRAIEGAVENRYQQIGKLDSIKLALKIPLEKTSNPSPLNQAKVIVKKIAPLSVRKEKPGACISDSDYEHILDSMRSAGASMESNRASEFQDEEALRDVMLVVLSGAITSGIAGGELFHKKGKTDISIPFENKATFVAECKLWKGSKYINEGVSQLLGYITWRDAKTAMVIFNKDNTNFSAIQNQIEDIFMSRQDYIKTINQRDGEWRFVLTKPDDPGRQIEVHVLLFDLYNKS